MNWNHIQVWSQAVDWLNIVLTFAVMVLPPLVVLALTALGGTALVAAGKKLAQAMREFVNDPTDAAIKWLAKQTGIPEQVLSDAITAVLDGFLNQPEVVDAPPQEAIPPVEAATP